MTRAGQGGRSDERAAGMEQMAQQARGTHGAHKKCHGPWLVPHCEAARCTAVEQLAPDYSCRVGCRHVGREGQGPRGSQGAQCNRVEMHTPSPPPHICHRHRQQPIIIHPHTSKAHLCGFSGMAMSTQHTKWCEPAAASLATETCSRPMDQCSWHRPPPGNATAGNVRYLCIGHSRQPVLPEYQYQTAYANTGRRASSQEQTEL